MSSRLSLVPAALALLLFTGCGGGGGGDPTRPGGGGGGGGDTFTATIDGVAWASDAAAISVTGSATPTRDGMLVISGYESATGRGLSLAISFFIGAATQPLGVNSGTTPGGSGTVLAPPDSWLTPMSGAAGMVTLSARTANRVAGTFHFTAEALAGATPASRVVTNGAFDITVEAGLPPLPAGVGSTMMATVGGAPWYAATIVGLNAGSGVFSLNASNTAYSITIVPKQPVAAGNSYGVPSQMGITVSRPGSTDSWWGGLGADIGTVTITTFATDRLGATFSGNLVPLNAAGGLLLAGGAINAYLAQ